MEAAHRNRAADVVEHAPRIIVVSAPPGYDKGGFFRACASLVGELTICDLGEAAEAPDLARGVLDALGAGDPARATRTAAARLARRPGQAAAASRDALRREWPLAARRELFVLQDHAGVLASPSGADLLAELIAALPAERMLGLSVRTALPPALQQIVAREPLTSIGPHDLAFDEADLAALARDAGLDPAVGRAIYGVTNGWPLVSRLLIGLARNDPQRELREAAEAQAANLLFSFAAHRTIARLGETLRDALAVVAVLRGAAESELVRVLGEDFDDASFARLVELAFVERDGERALLHAEVAALLRTRFGSLFRGLYERTLHVLSGDGAYVRAAQVALDGGDAVRAAAILDAVPPYTAGTVPLAEYERILDRLDRDLVTQYPNVWIATIPFRAFAVDRRTYVREAETIYYCLPHSASPHVRAVVLMHLVSGYANVGRSSETEQLLSEALAGFGRDDAAARAELLRFAATLRGIEGRFTEARALAAEADAIGGDSSFGENQTLHYIEAHEAAFRGRYDRAVVIFDEITRRLARAKLPLYLAHAATNAAFLAWVNGDDERFQRYLGLLEDSQTPGIERGFAPMIDAARGRPLQLDETYPWPVTAAIAQLYRLGEARLDDEALAAAREAVRYADERRDPFIQVVAHVALSVLDPAARAAEHATLVAITGHIESVELREAVRGLAAGGSAGILEAFVRRRVLRERASREPHLVIELLAGRVTSDGQPVKLTDRELELLAFLALAHGPISRDRIGEALWNHVEPEEWPNNLKVTLSRMRAKLGVHDAVLGAAGGYRLSPAIEVDLRRAEAVVRECANAPLDEPTREALSSILASYGAGSSRRFERFEWMQPSLARINDVVCAAGLALANDALRRSANDEALANARTVADVDPFNEAACEATIRALTARGDLDAARREFRRYANALAHELGAAPSPALSRLVRVNA